MKRLLAIILFILFGTHVFAQDFNDALTIYKTGEKTIAIKMFKQLSDKGDLKAQDMLSSIYNHGSGVKEDKAKAYKYARLAAVNQSLGSIDQKARGQYIVGYSYAFGFGVKTNYSLAYMWMAIANSNNAWNADNMLVWLGHSLTQKEKNEAIKMANKCISSNFKKCGY
tara:strand:- start:2383 stop:2886 length:504 start_codon:yes stop_codon:yes gene_type:complete